MGVGVKEGRKEGGNEGRCDDKRRDVAIMSESNANSQRSRIRTGRSYGLMDTTTVGTNVTGARVEVR